jgi:hypothetical protein
MNSVDRNAGEGASTTNARAIVHERSRARVAAGARRRHACNEEVAGVTGSLRALERFVRPTPERCQRCESALSARHRHAFDDAERSLVCICAACAQFESGAPGRFRLVPEAARGASSWTPDDAAWRALGVPKGLVFFVYHSARACWVAHLPTPFGAMQASISLDAAAALAAGNTLVRGIEPDVEALLVRHWRGRPCQCYAVPIDICYELVAIMRGKFRGCNGRHAIEEKVAEFFADLERQCRARPALEAGGRDEL